MHELDRDTSGQGASDILGDEAERLLSAAAVHDDAMMRLLARSADLENRGLVEVSRFEEQRTVVMDALAQLHAAEVSGGECYESRDRFLSAEAEKNRLWANVESLWAQSKRCLVWASDRQARAARIRGDAARLFAQAEATANERAPVGASAPAASAA